MWHTMLVIFVTFAMMPMALSWCFACACLTAAADILLTPADGLFQLAPSGDADGKLARAVNASFVSQLMAQLASKALIYLSVIFVSLYAKYLIDLKQRNAFLETRRSLDTRAKIERENSKQVSTDE